MLLNQADALDPKNSTVFDSALTDGDDERGLSFGSRRAIFDQHFHQRGRFGRLLNLTAQSVPRTGAAHLIQPSRLGGLPDLSTGS